MDDKKFSFEKLEVYTESRKLVREVYQLVKQLPSEERFALGAQIRRAIVQLSFPPLNHKPSLLTPQPSTINQTSYSSLPVQEVTKKGDSRKKSSFRNPGLSADPAAWPTPCRKHKTFSARQMYKIFF